MEKQRIINGLKGLSESRGGLNLEGLKALATSLNLPNKGSRSEIQNILLPHLDRLIHMSENNLSSQFETLTLSDKPLSNIFIGSKRKRGITGQTDPKIPDYLNIDVTSGSANKIDGHAVKLAFSPMYLGPFYYGDTLVQNFENFWQYGKIFPELGHINQNGELTDKWREFRNYGWNLTKGERHPKSTKTNDVIGHNEKGHNKYRYMTPVGGCYDNNDTILDYISARKLVYAPVYAYLVQSTDVFKLLKAKIDDGMKVQILDIDGPKDGSHPVTVELLKSKINDPTFPFGHGYILAGLLAGITPDQYTAE